MNKKVSITLEILFCITATFSLIKFSNGVLFKYGFSIMFALLAIYKGAELKDATRRRKR